MPRLEFIKMQGNGNDFIVIDNRQHPFPDAELSSLAVGLCRRRRSVGADGLLVIGRSGGADFTMRLFNSDGSEAEMCGNGARCAARYAFEKGLTACETVFSTRAGNIRARVSGDSVTLEMGMVDLSSARRKETFPYGMEEIVYSHLVVGVPHTVVFPPCTQGKTNTALRLLAEAIQADSRRFPQGTNVNFITDAKENLHVLTFERGVGDFTLSCGTGAAASALAAWLEGLANPPVAVVNPGGINTVDFPDDGNLPKIPVSLTGKAEYVFEGSLRHSLCGWGPSAS